MRQTKNFQEFINKGVVKKQKPDKQRANSLKKSSEKSYQFLKQIINNIKITDENANDIIKNTYDIIMELIRAKMLDDGFNASGNGAHEAEVSYLRELKIKESKVSFLNQLRRFRNGITYYGEDFSAEYAEMVVNFLEDIKRQLE